MRIIICLILLGTLFGQEKIKVVFNGNKTKLAKFEVKYIRDLLAVYEKEFNKEVNILYSGIKDFNNNFKILDASRKDNTVVINNITITEDRQKKYDFSIPYIYNKYALLSRKDYFDAFNSQKTRIAVVKGSQVESFVADLMKEMECSLSTFSGISAAVDALQAKQIDIIVDDYITSWVYDLRVVRVFKPQLSNEFGLMFNKGSRLKQELDHVIRKYQKTIKFRQLIKQHFGVHAKNFFKV